jgi:hypothetical protein
MQLKTVQTTADVQKQSHNYYHFFVSSGVFIEWLKQVGPERVVALVSDQAANMKAAREIVTTTQGFVHILSIRYR